MVLARSMWFTTHTQFICTGRDLLSHQKYSNLFLYFWPESPSTQLVLLDEWSYWHLSWGSRVAARTQSLSPECSSCRCLTQCACPCGMLALWAIAVENLPDSSSEYWDSFSQDMGSCLPPLTTTNATGHHDWNLQRGGKRHHDQDFWGWREMPPSWEWYDSRERMIHQCKGLISIWKPQDWTSTLKTSISTPRVQAAVQRTASAVRDPDACGTTKPVGKTSAGCWGGCSCACLHPLTAHRKIHCSWFWPWSPWHLVPGPASNPLPTDICMVPSGDPSIGGPYHSNATVPSTARGELPLSMFFHFWINSMLQCDTHRLT